MHRQIAAFALSLAAALPGLAAADELTIVDQAPSREAVTLPRKGEAKAAVIKTFGQPQTRHAPVGGDAPTHPPITRWDYAGFSVFFEREHVVDAVVPGRPAQVFHTENLKPASDSY